MMGLKSGNQAITWSNADILLMRFCDIYLREQFDGKRSSS